MSPSPPSTSSRSWPSPLSVPADVFLFDEGERGPGGDLRLPFEAPQRVSDAEQHLVREFLEAILLKHEAKRWIEALAAAKGKQ